MNIKHCDVVMNFHVTTFSLERFNEMLLENEAGCRNSRTQGRQKAEFAASAALKTLPASLHRKSGGPPTVFTAWIALPFFFFFKHSPHIDASKQAGGGVENQGVAGTHKSRLAQCSSAPGALMPALPTSQPPSLPLFSPLLTHTSRFPLLHPSSQRAALPEQRGVLRKRPLRFYSEASEQGSVVGSLFGTPSSGAFRVPLTKKCSEKVCISDYLGGSYLPKNPLMKRS